MDVNEELKFFLKNHKKKQFFFGGVGLGGGGQDGCERRIEVFVEIQKKNWGGGGVGRGGVLGRGGRVWGWGSGWMWVRVDVNEELKFLGKFKKKIGGGWVQGGGGSGWGGGGSGWM